MMTEFVKLFLTLGFAKVLLIILGLVAAVFVWIWFANAMAAQMAGWKQLVEKYPAPEIERTRRDLQEVDRQYRQHGVQVELHGAINSGRVAVRPGFAARRPILIPWFKISEVAVSEGTVFGREQYLQLTVEWEKRFLLSLPPEALPTFEKNVPADRFRKVKVPPRRCPNC